MLCWIETQIFQNARDGSFPKETVVEVVSPRKKGALRQEDVGLAEGRLERRQTDGEVPDPESSLEVELTFWNSIKDSDNAEMFSAYLDKYPDGQFRSVAEIRLSELKSPRA